MFKKSIAAVIFSFIMVLSVGTGAFASDFTVVDQVPYYEVNGQMNDETKAAIAEINAVNADIEAEIAKNQVKAEKMYAQYLTELAEEKDAQKQQQLTAQYEDQISKLISKLQEKAEKMTEKGIEKAEKAGITADIVLVDVLFGDRFAKIDPIIVVAW